MKKEKNIIRKINNSKKLKHLLFGTTWFRFIFYATIPVTMQRRQQLVVKEVACCDQSHTGPWYGEWEPCFVLPDKNIAPGFVMVRCMSDQLEVAVPKRFVRKMKRWTCAKCTYLNRSTERECKICNEGLRPGTEYNEAIAAIAARETEREAAWSVTPVTHFKKKRSQEELVAGEQQPKKQKHFIFNVYQVAGCNADHVGEWKGLWEDCKLISDNKGSVVDVQINSDGMKCFGVPKKFVRLKQQLHLVDRQWI